MTTRVRVTTMALTDTAFLGLLRGGDPLLQCITSAESSSTKPRVSEASTAEANPSKPLTEGGGDEMWEADLLMEFARSLSVVKRLIPRKVEGEVAKEAKQPRCARVATTVQEMQSSKYSSIQVQALYLLCTIRTEMLKEKEKMKQLKYAMLCLSHPEVKREMARAISICSQVGDLLEHEPTCNSDSEDSPGRAEEVEQDGGVCPLFPLPALDSLKEVKSRYHPELTLQEAITHALLFTTDSNLQSILPADHELVREYPTHTSASDTILPTPRSLTLADCIKNSVATLRDQFDNLLCPVNCERSTRFARAGAAPPPPHLSTLNQMKYDVRNTRSAIRCALESLGEVSKADFTSPKAVEVRGLQHLKALLTFVEYEFEVHFLVDVCVCV